MSFVCGNCGQQQPPRHKAHRVVLEGAPINYPYRPKANYQKVEGVWKHTDDKGGTGWQIVKEAIWCAECANSEAIRVEGINSRSGQ